MNDWQNNHLDNQQEFLDQEATIATGKVGFWELCYGVLFSPRETFRKMKNQPPLFYGLLILLGSTLLSSLANFLIGMPAQVENLPSEYAKEFQALYELVQSPGFSVISALIGVLLSLLFWVVTGGFLQMVAEFLGGRGKGLEVLAVISFATLPMIFLIPVEAGFYAANLPNGLSFIVSLPLMIWSYLVLPIIGLKEVHEISTPRAAATVLAPVITLIALTILLVIIISLATVPFFAQLQNQI